MPAAYQNLYIEQGTTYSTTITLDDIYGTSYNLTGYIASSQLRPSYYSANAIATFNTQINANTGVITLSLSAPITANISPGRYVYDAIIIDINNNVTRVLEGIAEISPSVTR
jgi:hypothetical protein